MNGSAPADAGAVAHAFVDDLERPVLDDDDRRHFERVLRLRAGEQVTVADGAGSWRVVEFGPVLRAVSDVACAAAPSPPISIGFALVKGDRPEWIVQKLTELGVDRIVPLVTDRCVVRWEGAKADHHVERLRRVARGAAMQSRRAFLPVVEAVTQFDAAVRAEGAVLAERGGAPPALTATFVLIGPEGGWSADEKSGAPHVGLAREVLRVETAAITAGALLTALRSGLVVGAES
ncbi:MAG: 16S rRNA (uracil(1498)-N(3))-methyltransferase [Acidimicrobiia bacterium]